jgi:hypothetical protein
MTKTANSVRDDRLLTALAAGHPVAAAAQLAGVSERTAYRRLADPDFRTRVHAMRMSVLDAAVGELLGASTLAVATLRRLLKEAPPTVQLGAAKAVLELGAALQERVELEARLTALEAGK